MSTGRGRAGSSSDRAGTGEPGRSLDWVTVGQTGSSSEQGGNRGSMDRTRTGKSQLWVRTDHTELCTVQ